MRGAAPLTWIVGSGGLLGSHLVREEARRGTPLWSPGPIGWTADEVTQSVLGHAREFVRTAGDRPWRVLWCAGAGVTGASEAALARELDVFEAALQGLATTTRPGQGSIFLASSAGGLYAGGEGPPFDETSTPRPLAPYGRAKLAAEDVLRSWGADTEVSVLAGRIANLYGPGQNLAKPQGLISQMLKAQLTAQPLSIYVSLDTLRDYLFVQDAAELVSDAMARLEAEAYETGGPVRATKVLASLRPVTIGEIIGEIGLITKRRPRIVIASSPVSAFQARNLSLRSVVWPELDQRPRTPLPVGIHRTASALRAQWGTEGLTGL